MDDHRQLSLGGRRYGGIILSVVVLVAAVLLVFGRVGGHEFLMYDDEPHLVDNPRFNPVTWSNVGLFWVEKSYWGLYIPLSYTFFGAEAWIAGQPLDPTVFHLGNLVLHVACVLLVFVVLRRLCRHDGAACAAALLFGLHPVQVESVAWISETRGLLCAVFSLLAIWQFDLWCRAPSESGKSAVLCYVLATVAFVLALLSKPAAVAVPLVAGVLAVGASCEKGTGTFCRNGPEGAAHKRRLSPFRRLLGLGPWLLIAAGCIVWTRCQQPSVQMAFVAPLWARPLIAGDALAFYLIKLVVPVPCGPDYGRSPAWVLEQWWIYYIWILPAALFVALARLKNRRVWLTAAGVFVAWLLPVLGLVPFDFQRISTVADRYLYLSLLGPALALGWFLARRWNWLTIAVTASVLALLGVLSLLQTAHWHDNASLIAHGLRVNRRSVLAKQHRGELLNRKGRLLSRKGKHAEAMKTHEEATRWYREALKVDPRHEEAYVNLANSLVALERVDEAEKSLREALRHVPMRPAVHCKLAEILKEQGKTDEAEDHYRTAFRLAPDCFLAYLGLGKLQFDRGATEKAIALYRKALDVHPYYVEAQVNLGLALERQGNVHEASHRYREALKIRPGEPLAHFNLGNLLFAQGAVEPAVRHYRAALKSYPNYARAHVNLGIALIAQEKIPEAIGHYEAALKIQPDLVEAHVHLGHALAAQQRDEAAAAAYRAALKLVPPDSPEAEQIRRFLRPYETP